jgi:lysophospholipase L1-like esterase
MRSAEQGQLVRNVAVAFLAVVALAVAPASAWAFRYVAMGDSYSSGVGTRQYYEASGSCKRGPRAYPKLVNYRLDRLTGRNQRHEFVACAGAKTGDVLEHQLGPLNRRTRWVTISIGGNDAGFAPVVKECAKPEWASDCEGEVRRARRFIRNELPTRLEAVYRAISRRTPRRAKLIAVGYPRLFNGEDCNGATFFDADDMVMLNETADLLARVQRRSARRRGFRFVDPRAAFIGHAVCDDVEWINGLSNPPGESYHPNVLGNRAYARLVMRKIR